MVRIRCAIEIVQMAGDAGGAVEAVVPVHVALRTLQRGMRAGQREPCGRVIERCPGPGDGRMAGIASSWKPGRRMIRIRRSLVVGHVAGRTSSSRQVVVPVHMTLRALQARMGAGEREPCGRMIEGCVCPRNCIVAALAGLRESRLYVIGIGGPLIVG